MRVLFFIPAMNSGGAERVMATICNSIVEMENMEIELLTMNTNSSFYSLNPKIHKVDMQEVISSSGVKRFIELPYREYMRRRKFIKEVNGFCPDVVVSFLFTTNIIAVSASNNIKCPIIVSERNDPTHYNKIIQFFCKKFYRKSSVIVCQGKKVQEYYSSSGGNCIVIPNPINVEAIGKYSSERKDIVVSVGRLTAAKNHKMTIKAFSNIHTKFPSFELHIYGEGEQKDELLDLIKDLKAESYIKLMGSKVNIFANVSASKAFVLASNYEGFPNVLVEAMSSGLPVISTDFSSGVANELIHDGENGFLIPVGDQHELEKKLSLLLSSDDLIHKFSVSNLSLLEEYSVNAISNKWVNLLKNISNTTNKGKMK